MEHDPLLPELAGGSRRTCSSTVSSSPGADGRPDFHRLSHRMLHGDQAMPVTYVVFDVLAVEGLPTTMLPYSERRALLETLDWQGPSARADGVWMKTKNKATARFAEEFAGSDDNVHQKQAVMKRSPTPGRDVSPRGEEITTHRALKGLHASSDEASAAILDILDDGESHKVSEEILEPLRRWVSVGMFSRVTQPPPHRTPMDRWRTRQPTTSGATLARFRRKRPGSGTDRRGVVGQANGARTTISGRCGSRRGSGSAEYGKPPSRLLCPPRESPGFGAGSSRIAAAAPSPLDRAGGYACRVAGDQRAARSRKPSRSSRAAADHPCPHPSRDTPPRQN